jgi:hypothetical protein
VQNLIVNAIQKSTLSLLNMISEMYRKEIELARIGKTSALLIMSGVSCNSISQNVIELCVRSQKEDGGWIGVADTIWCAKLLSFYGEKYHCQIRKAYEWLKQQKVEGNGWGRSSRDMGRIPVTGILHFLAPDIVEKQNSEWLENLWVKEKNSITYKAAYTLMAFKAKEYMCKNRKLIKETTFWLESQQNEDGGFGPWKGHPVGSNILCTAIAVVGLLQYKEFIDNKVFKRAEEFIVINQLPNGLWRYHQIEDGASWGLFALSNLYNHLS